MKHYTIALFLVLGCMIYSSAVCIFIAPNKITPGGITGIATVINYIFGVPSGLTVFLLNIPIIILGYISFGGNIIVKSAVGTVVLSGTLELCELFIPPFVTDKILAGVFGGILLGFGLSLVLFRGTTTGGIDIIAKVINKKFPHITVGRVFLILDALVVILSSAVYKTVESGLYSAIALYTASTVMDAVLYGADKGKIIYVISEKSAQICKEINTAAHRGVTRLPVKGGYTGNDMEMLMCTVRVQEVSGILRIINECDKTAFIIIAEAGEILGEGFKYNNI